MARRTRVLHSLFRVGSGGVEQTRLTLARGLDSKRYEQRIVCLDAFGALPTMLDAAGCPVTRVGDSLSIFAARAYRDVVKMIREWNPDIVHGAVYEGVAMATVAGRLARVPVVIGEETSEPVGRSGAGNTLYRLLCGLTDRMVAVSPAVVDYLVKGIHVPAGKVTLVANGVASPGDEDTVATREIRRRFAIEPDSFVIGTVGRLQDSNKRVSDLIRAMPALCQSIGDARLLVVGDGEDANMLASLADELGVAERVHFCGYQADTSSYYRVMDVFALASAHEAFGLVLVEAMLVGLATVATRVGGIPSVVDDGVTGLLVPALDPSSLAAALVDLHRAPARRTEMGARGKARAEAHFGAARYVDAIDHLYTQCLENARR